MALEAPCACELDGNGEEPPTNGLEGLLGKKTLWGFVAVRQQQTPSEVKCAAKAPLVRLEGPIAKSGLKVGAAGKLAKLHTSCGFVKYHTYLWLPFQAIEHQEIQCAEPASCRRLVHAAVLAPAAARGDLAKAKKRARVESSKGSHVRIVCDSSNGSWCFCGGGSIAHVAR